MNRMIDRKGKVPMNFVNFLTIIGGRGKIKAFTMKCRFIFVRKLYFFSQRGLFMKKQEE